jgi:hypothetical protein
MIPPVGGHIGTGNLSRKPDALQQTLPQRTPSQTLFFLEFAPAEREVS